jgi:hypothetical protein
MIKLRDPHDDAKLAMRELNDDIVAQPKHPLRALAGIHLTTAHLQYDEGKWLECIESCSKGYAYLTGDAIKKNHEASRNGVLELFPAPKFLHKEVS